MSAAPERPELDDVIACHKASDPPDELGEQFCNWCEYAWPCEPFGLATYALRLEAQRDAAREALRKYGRHSPGCIARPSGATWDDEVICKCGLSVALGEAGHG